MLRVSDNLQSVIIRDGRVSLRPRVSVHLDYWFCSFDLIIHTLSAQQGSASCALSTVYPL